MQAVNHLTNPTKTSTCSSCPERIIRQVAATTRRRHTAIANDLISSCNTCWESPRLRGTGRHPPRRARHVRSSSGNDGYIGCRRKAAVDQARATNSGGTMTILRCTRLSMIAALLFWAPSTAMAQGSRSDYERATKFLPDQMRSLVYDGQVDPQWIG